MLNGSFWAPKQFFQNRSLDFPDFVPDDRHKKWSKVTILDFSMKILIIPKMGVMGHFLGHKKHF